MFDTTPNKLHEKELHPNIEKERKTTSKYKLKEGSKLKVLKARKRSKIKENKKRTKSATSVKKKISQKKMKKVHKSKKLPTLRNSSTLFPKQRKDKALKKPKIR